ncbi:MAG: cation-transporting P-type ATPase [Chloroflexi bacterium]|nr:cation-transporting P-type ATPase [Chloroflexota bacterium]
MPDDELSNAPAWHALPIHEVAARLATDPARGLTAEEARRRRERCGANELAAARPEPWWREAGEALTEPMVLLLIAVGILYALLGQAEDALTIFAVIFAVTAIETANETRARRAIEALRRLDAPTAAVVRDGVPTRIAARDVVPGDLVLLQLGERVPADLRLIETTALRIDESVLTGESVPAVKQADLVHPARTPAADRQNLAFAGTLVTAGRGRGLVIAIGQATELGRTARLAKTAHEPRTPLQQELARLAGAFLWIAIGASVLIPLAGTLVAHQPPREMLLTGLTLAFATIPEELPILATIVLALGARALAHRRAVVRRLRAAEAIGSVSVIATDKTGTLTANRLSVSRLFVDGAPYLFPPPAVGAGLHRLFAVAMIANSAPSEGVGNPDPPIGDPIDAAVLEAARRLGLDTSRIRASARVHDEHPLDAARRAVLVVAERDDGWWLAAKGAPEVILPACSHVFQNGRPEPLDARGRAALLEAAAAMARDGLRVLGFADRPLAAAPAGGAPLPVGDLTFLGLIGLTDPPRPEAAEAIAALRAAGVRVLMLTGDHPATARAVARQVGIPAERIIHGTEVETVPDDVLWSTLAAGAVVARVTPAQKLRIVRLLQERGDVVAVTGDGVNDAPALRAATVGIAMGQTGSDVAREAADLVLTDDNLATIAAAVRAGRVLYANLRKAVRFYLAAKFALVGSALAAVLAGRPVPFAPVQIILLELVMDLGASTTFVVEPPEDDVMARPPRNPRGPFLDRSMALAVFAGGLTLGLITLAAFLPGWGRGIDDARSAAFLAWMIGHVALAAHMRTEQDGLAASLRRPNRSFWIWVGGVLLLLLLAFGVPPLRQRLHLTPLAPTSLAVIGTGALIAPMWWEVARQARRGMPRVHRLVR